MPRGKYDRHPELSILVPFRAEAGEPGVIRTQNWEWLKARWNHFFPDAQIVVGTEDGMPFSKTTAINNAYARARGKVFVLADADSWVPEDQIRRAVAFAKQHRVLVIPWQDARRLDKVGRWDTKAILAMDPSTPNPVSAEAFGRADDYKPSPFTAAMVTVITREDFESVGGMDPRFRGWGAEDVAFALACDTLLGKNKLMLGHAWALHHERPRLNQRRVWEGDDAHHNIELGDRYWQSRGKPEEMTSLCSEHPLATAKTLVGIGPGLELRPSRTYVPEFEQAHEVELPPTVIREFITGGTKEGERIII